MLLLNILVVVPTLSTSAAYGVYMAVSSNLRYQILAGVIEQRILDPMLHEHKLILSAICFAVRTWQYLPWVINQNWIKTAFKESPKLLCVRVTFIIASGGDASRTCLLLFQRELDQSQHCKILCLNLIQQDKCAPHTPESAQVFEFSDNSWSLQQRRISHWSLGKW